MAAPQQIKPSEHIFICGGTGSGKSALADVYTAGMSERVIKIDIKNDTLSRRFSGAPIWRGLVENEDFEVVETLEAVKRSEYQKIIYCPGFEEQEIEVYNDLARFVYDSAFDEPCRLWIDELMLFSQNAVKYPEFLKAILVSGRSRNATVLCCAQRPLTIPSIVIPNTQHFFIFRMNNADDRKKVARDTGCEKFLIPPERYAFWYYREGEPEESVKQYRLKLED